MCLVVERNHKEVVGCACTLGKPAPMVRGNWRWWEQQKERIVSVVVCLKQRLVVITDGDLGNVPDIGNVALIQRRALAEP